MRLAAAIQSLKAGRPIVVFDSVEREGEADIMVHARFATAAAIRLLRKDGGGLICLATNAAVAKKLQLPFLTDLYSEDRLLRRLVYKKTKYGDKPAFSVSINHKNTFTGISDIDRALTSKEFAKILEKEETRSYFVKNFRIPGHLHLLIGRRLKERRGHTELAMALVELAGLTPAILMCEMLGENGQALNGKEAERYAKRRGFIFIEGKEVVESHG